MRAAEGWFAPGGVQRAGAFGQEDGVPVGPGGVGQVAGWTSAAPIEGDAGGHTRGERVEVGVGARAFDAHDFVEGAHACEGAPPGVHVSGRVDDDAARFDADACTVSANVEDAVGLACGVVAGPGGPRVDTDAGKRFLIVNILGRQVGDAHARVDGRGSDGVDCVGQALLDCFREHEGGSDARVAQASPRGVPVKVEQGRVGKDTHDRVGVEAWASSSMMGASVPGRASADRPARVTRPGSAGRREARARWWLPWS